MAMAMGVASLAVTTAPKHAALVTPRASTNRGEKQGFLDWFRTAMDKESLSEMDAVMAKGNEDAQRSENVKSSSNGKNSGNGNAGNGKQASVAPKKGGGAAPPKRGGFSFFGKK